jgi:hypothetical protein
MDRYYLIAAALGTVVGLAEIVSRYKDAPGRALWTASAWLYIGLNGLASLAAFILVKQVPALRDIGGSGPEGDLVKALVAGVSAMALFRSSLFTVRVGNADIGIGPAAFLQILLFAADRATDRARASPRAIAVQATMKGISFDRAKEALPSLCFGLMQGLTTEEQTAFGISVKALESSKMEDTFKANSLGLSLMNLVGEEVLGVAVNKLRSDIRAKPKPIVQSVQTLSLLKKVDFAQSYRTLVDSCRFAANLNDETDLQNLEAEVARIAALGIADQTKVLMLSSMLVDRFGEDVVQLVLRSLTENQPATANPVNPPLADPPPANPPPP